MSLLWDFGVASVLAASTPLSQILDTPLHTVASTLYCNIIKLLYYCFYGNGCYIIIHNIIKCIILLVNPHGSTQEKARDNTATYGFRPKSVIRY